MRILAIFFAPVLLGGCVHLGAKPMNFSCGALLTDNSETYQSTPYFSTLQRDAGFDDCPAGADGKPECGSISVEAFSKNKNVGKGKDKDNSDAAILDALADWRSRKAMTLSSKATGPSEVPVLMLSGGGAWGAFGAAYLNAIDRRDWAVVTGVSTGALQGLFVAAGDYVALEEAYRIKTNRALAKPNGLWGLVFRGSENDISPLRARVMAYLLPSDGAESPLLRMARTGSPALSIAMVEARSGDLKAVHISKMVQAELGQDQQPNPAKLKRLAECVAGVALASSSIPVRLTPVQIDGRTYIDGGVRSSVFDTTIGKTMQADSKRTGTQPHLYVIRNGPTIVFRDGEEEKRPGVAKVDARPDILRVGLRGYSTIVNQNELMSIASLRLNYPSGPISVISADGFNTPIPVALQDGSTLINPAPCGPRPDELFDKDFMACLANWGKYKAKNGPQFIELEPLDVAFQHAVRGTN